MENGLLLWILAVGGSALVGVGLVLIRVGTIKHSSDAMLSHYVQLLDNARRKRAPEEEFGKTIPAPVTTLPNSDSH